MLEIMKHVILQMYAMNKD